MFPMTDLMTAMIVPHLVAILAHDTQARLLSCGIFQSTFTASIMSII